jgi:ArsR family transcriptional regulator
MAHAKPAVAMFGAQEFKIVRRKVDHQQTAARHQHARLGFSDRQMAELLRSAGFAASDPIALKGGELVVKIWLGKRRAASVSASTSALEPAR